MTDLFAAIDGGAPGDVLLGVLLVLMGGAIFAAALWGMGRALWR